ncbi:hypothetical protein BDY19DRAFT_903923 [Irpex rosettiformis]|uniref:Uncharacterized protein n=1 Tax=Irpex rosettiformis TaxID=378272 RepID=A0ACB8UD84_9APHY|nr:hypothetical protein BDY19DRAFT_903923 [Irpex rosettiformis]
MNGGKPTLPTSARDPRYFPPLTITNMERTNLPSPPTQLSPYVPPPSQVSQRKSEDNTSLIAHVAREGEVSSIREHWFLANMTLPLSRRKHEGGANPKNLPHSELVYSHRHRRRHKSVEVIMTTTHKPVREDTFNLLSATTAGLDGDQTKRGYTRQDPETQPSPQKRSGNDERNMNKTMTTISPQS